MATQRLCKQCERNKSGAERAQKMHQVGESRLTDGILNLGSLLCSGILDFLNQGQVALGRREP